MAQPNTITSEFPAPSRKGMPFLIGNILIMFIAIGAFVRGVIYFSASQYHLLSITLFVVGILYMSLLGPFFFVGLKVLKPNEALVLTLFGRYIGTLRGPGFFFVHPFAIAIAPSSAEPTTASLKEKQSQQVSFKLGTNSSFSMPVRKISLKVMTLSNDRQKVNDSLGNPIIIGIVVVWKVIDTAKALFNVDNFTEYLSIQCDSALRNIVRLYPYDVADDEGEGSLRGSSQEVAKQLTAEIQDKVSLAGLEILEARITHLSYAPEIAAAMLQRQQATAIIAARQMIVDGAVGMVQMALEKLNENKIVDLDEERKASMVSNLLVILCGNRDAQPIVNSGSIY